MIRRWQQLPLDHALCAYPAVRDLVQTVADQGAMARNLPVTNVPDLGPSVVMDQLLVVVFDYQSADLDVESLANRLTELRRRLP